MQPITLNTLFNRNEIKNLKDTQKFLVFFIFHLIALFVLLFVNAYVGYSKNQTERELKELKILKFGIKNNTYTAFFALIQFFVQFYCIFQTLIILNFIDSRKCPFCCFLCLNIANFP